MDAENRIILKIPIEEIVEAFNEMKSRNPDIYTQTKIKCRKASEKQDDSDNDFDWLSTNRDQFVKLLYLLSPFKKISNLELLNQRRFVNM